jgi:ribosomal protein L37AE/L43A
MKSKKTGNKLQEIMPKLYASAMQEPVKLKLQCAVCGDREKAHCSRKIYLCSKKCKDTFQSEMKDIKFSPEVEELLRSLSDGNQKAYEFIKWWTAKDTKKARKK